MYNGCNGVSFGNHGVPVQKATAFPLGSLKSHRKALEEESSSLLSSVTDVMRLPISCVSCITISCHTSCWCWCCCCYCYPI